MVSLYSIAASVFVVIAMQPVKQEEFAEAAIYVGIALVMALLANANRKGE